MGIIKTASVGVAATSLSLTLGLAGWYHGTQYRASKVSPILEDIAYRSAQPTAETIEDAVATYDIKSVLNLRGTVGRHIPEEEEAVEKFGLAYAVHTLSASVYPDPDVLLSVLHAYDGIPKPVLIHCRAGIDRTGLIATLLLIEQGEHPDTADRHLSFLRGHMPPWKDTWKLDSFVEMYERAYEKSGLGLRSWIDTEYREWYASQ